MAIEPVIKNSKIDDHDHAMEDASVILSKEVLAELGVPLYPRSKNLVPEEKKI